MSNKLEAIELRSYNLLNDLEDDQDVIDSFIGDYSGSTYICDAISEIADSQIPIYTSDIWDGARNIREYIEEAQESGLCEGVTDIDKIMQAGYYQYYTQVLYDNLDTMAFNIVAEKVNNKLADLDDDAYDLIDLYELDAEIENETDGYDNNNTFDDLDSLADDLIERIADGEFSQEEE